MSKKKAAPAKGMKGPMGKIAAVIILGAIAASVVLSSFSGVKPVATPAASSSQTSSTSATPATSTDTPAQGPSIARIAAEAKGFSVGPVGRAHTTYVFFDSQCKHCAALWENMKPLADQTRAVWIPVGVLGAASVAQGSVILGAEDPVAKMNEHKELMAQGKRGISAMGTANDEQKAIIEANTKLMQEMGGTGVPFIVARNAETGQTVSRAGAGPTPAIAGFLGLKAPTP